MRRYLILTVALLTLMQAAWAQQGRRREIDPATLPEFTYPARVHDPVMIKQGDTYYMFTTGHGIPIQTSKDMKTWSDGGTVFKDGAFPAWHREFIPEQDGNLWAPDICYKDGKYWLYYSVSAWMNFDSSIGLATNTTLDPTDPNYKWVDQGVVVSYRNHMGEPRVNVIDPNMMIDADGRWWLFYGSYQHGLRLVELNPSTGKMLNEQNPHIFVITDRIGEGVFVLRSNGYYYLFCSEGKCCAGMNTTYHVLVGCSENVYGPYMSRTGAKLQDVEADIFIKGDKRQPGKGHNGFILDGKELKFIYHAYTDTADGASLLGVQTVYQDEDGWPTLENTGKLFEIENLNL